ncbi:MAG TPA: sugar ABC transporter ATP-binding protein [Vicinamibacteria bacterium]
MSDEPSSTPAVTFEGIGKRFPGVKALEGVTFDVAAGSCHALCGENGAGKSTLGKILAGVHAPDAGRLLVFGREVHFHSPREALEAGVAMVHQELAFCPNLSVAENLCLGRLPAKALLVQRDELRRRARAMIEGIGVALDVDRLAGSLTIGQRQMMQIASAVSTGARVIVFDEPTSSLSEHEAVQLFQLMGRLKAQGVTCIYVSHRMPEIFRLCDTATVLRDGQHVATRPLAELDEAALVQMMIGRRLEGRTPDHVKGQPGRERLRVEGLTSPGKFHDVSFTLRAGEVLGLAGLVGAGRSELAQALFGLDPAATGRVVVDGQPVHVDGPVTAMRLGLGLVPEDRQHQGLVLGMSGTANTSLPILERLARFVFIRLPEERKLAAEHFGRLRVRTPGLEFPVAGLSGGNQQKIVLAKWLAARCGVLMLDEPTRGVDVGAKAEIHALIDQLAVDGNAILLISSELPELLSLSTRILVLRAGRVAGEVAREQATEESVMRLMAGVAEGPRQGSAA